MAPGHHDQAHDHRHVLLDEAEWAAQAAQTELEGELLLGFVTDTAAWLTELRDPAAPPVRRIIDIGSGPGVGACELAMSFPDALVVAVDSSPGMLARAGHRIDRLGLEVRVSTHLAALPDGIGELAPADAIWTAMALHHVGDEVSALRAMGDRLAPNGLLAVAERADPMRVLPDALDVGRPGLADRLDGAAATWFAHMRDGLADSAPSADLTTMVAAAGLDVVGARRARLRVDEPLSDDARTFVVGYLQRCREQLTEFLDDEDLAALDVLTDADDPRSVQHRSDVFIAASRQIVIAARRGDTSTPAPDAG